MGFWVARSTNGVGSRWRTPSTVTAPSSIASRNADWVRGGVRLSSSTRTTWANIGPATKVSRLPSHTPEPVMSEGSRSAVAWTRRNVPPIDWPPPWRGWSFRCRDVLDQDVASGEHTAHRELDRGTPAPEYPLDVGDQRLPRAASPTGGVASRPPGSPNGRPALVLDRLEKGRAHPLVSTVRSSR